MAATMDICAPADQTEGTRSQVLRWLKAVGDTVAQHEPLIELETDKVTVEVAAPASGVLREIVKGEQEEIAPGEVLGRLEVGGESAEAAGMAGAQDVAAVENGATAFDGTFSAASVAVGARTRASVAGESPQAEVVGDGTKTIPGGAGAGGDSKTAASAAHRLSPAVRRLLEERGLDPSAIQGTGEGGRITVDDVAAFDATARDDAKEPTAHSKTPIASTVHTSASSSSARAPALRSPMPHLPEPSGYTGPRSHSVPHSAIRKRIADHMVQSLLQTAPHVTTVFEADMSAVLAHRAARRAEFQQRGVPLTLTAYFLAATVAAIKAVPEANSRWTDTALEIYDDIHVGVATAVEGAGLVVPVVRDVESLDLFGTASRLDELVTATRDGRLAPADVRGGTFTISNHGVSGSLLATPIVINQPQSAILGIGKMEKRPVVIEDGDEEKVVVRPKCYVTLTIDHRVMDGHQANRFLQTFVRTLESWPRDA